MVSLNLLSALGRDLFVSMGLPAGFVPSVIVPSQTMLGEHPGKSALLLKGKWRHTGSEEEGSWGRSGKERREGKLWLGCNV